MIYAVIDTNVLVSAVMTKHPESATTRVLEYIFAKIITPLYDDTIIEEYLDVLNRPALHIHPIEAQRLVKFIITYGISTERTAFNEVLRDEKDRVFYEVSLSKENSYLVTGNKKHFPLTPNVVSPAEMIAIIDASD